MTTSGFDDSALLAAMRAFLAASDALDHATTDVDVLNRSELKRMAAMTLRKRLADAGWVADGQRTST